MRESSVRSACTTLVLALALALGAGACAGDSDPSAGTPDSDTDRDPDSAASSDGGDGSESDVTSVSGSSDAATVPSSSIPDNGGTRATTPIEKTELGHVIVDHAGPAFMVVMGVPAGDELEGLEQTAELLPEVQLVPWEDFQADLDGLVTSRILKDEYDADTTVDDLVAAIQAEPSTPIGLTWNGGIAVTETDQQFAIEGHDLWTEDPDAYEAQRPERPGDPIHPDNHLPLYLGG